ncbi:amino acid permease/ SLC12A domain-containing protein [Xylariales sp. PMI_506]|nr:amino acid permease/ SLC12A domain-containing protein [Xylariales sp. PMI_506]
MASPIDPVPAHADEKGWSESPAYGAEEMTGDVETRHDYFREVDQLSQGLKQRHIQMIALAGAIGTGLFLGSGSALAKGGPLGAFLGYTITGLLASSVALAVGEMGALVPLSGGIVRYSELFADPALSFAVGWNLVYFYLVSNPNEIVAAAVLVQFWVTINNAVWITVFSILVIIACSLFIRVYGELEFGFSMLKIILIVLVNILALVVTCGGGPTGEVIGFKYWRDPGLFVQYLDIPGPLGRFLGFWSTFSSAIYSYSGMENITMPAAEIDYPRRAIPKAARRIFWRILIFYVISIFMVTLVVASNDTALLTASNTAASPFVIAANNAGIKVIPSVINAIVITSAWSSANSGMLAGSRSLYGLAQNGKAPKIFTRLNRFNIPYVAVGLLSVFLCLGFMTLSDSASTVFAWLINLVSVAALVNWSVILFTYLRFQYGCKAQGIDRSELPWAAPFQPYLSWFSLFMFLLLLLTSGYTTFIHGHWDTETFVSSYIDIPIILVLYFGYKFATKSKLIPLSEIPIRQFIQIAQENPEPPEAPKRGLQRLNILWS